MAKLPRYEEYRRCHSSFGFCVRNTRSWHLESGFSDLHEDQPINKRTFFFKAVFNRSVKCTVWNSEQVEDRSQRRENVSSLSLFSAYCNWTNIQSGSNCGCSKRMMRIHLGDSLHWSTQSRAELWYSSMHVFVWSVVVRFLETWVLSGYQYTDYPSSV